MVSGVSRIQGQKANGQMSFFGFLVGIGILFLMIPIIPFIALAAVLRWIFGN